MGIKLLNVAGALATTGFIAALGLPSGALAAAPVTSDLALWLEADQGLAPDGSTWADQSGNGHDATALGSAPTVVPGAINGLPAVQFSGGQAMSLSGQVLTSQQFTVVALASDVTTAGSPNTGFREIFSNWDPSNSVTSAFLGTTSVDPVKVRFTDDIGGATDPVNTQSGVGQVPNPSNLFVLAGVSGASDAQVFLNGGLLFDKGSAISARDLTTGYFIGEQGSSPFEYWNGDIEELLVYNGALTPAQIAQDTAYLAQKYSFSVGVPEPATWAMMLVGLGGLGLAMRRGRRKAAAAAPAA